MKTLAKALLLAVMLGFSFNALADGTAKTVGPCPDEDVWVYIKHNDPNLLHDRCIVQVTIKKHTLVGDFNNCPANNTRLPGLTTYGTQVIVTLTKGTLNDPNKYTTIPPEDIEIRENNMDTWRAEAW